MAATAALHHVIVCLFCLIAVTSAADAPQPLFYRILEEQTPGTLVADVAKDAHIIVDTPRQRQQQTRPNNHRQPSPVDPSFQILQNQTNFVIDPQSGTVRTAAILDRDSICPRKRDCRLEIDVAVYTRRGSSPNLVKVVFDLVDLNDNAPVFPKPFVVETVSEATQVGPGGLPFFVLPADDLDSPANGVVSYRMESDADETFGLAVETGDDEFQDIRVVLNEPLDREKRDRYRIRIIAIDGGGGGTPRSGSTTIQIEVGDVNDNSPVFTSATYRAEVTENAPPQHSLVAVTAGDADAGANGRVTYSLSAKTAAQHGSTFSVDPDTGVISLLTPVDYERTKQFVLEVVAVDGGELPIPATARVSVEVRDANDNVPEIRLESATVQSGSHSHPVLYVTENSPSNHYVALLAVNDADSGPNGRVNCSLSGPPHHHHQQFQLVQITDWDFKIVTGDSLIDRESVDRHDLNVTCSDRGTPRRSASFPIVVVVEDLNDNKPVFSRDFYNFSIEENNEDNVFVGQISAVDADNEKNGQVEYRIQQNASAWFSLDQKTGSLRALRRFDREANESFRFLVYASDFGPERWHSNAVVQVNVLDQDDEGPRFTHRRYVFNITDDVPSLTEIGQVIALDRDQPPRNRFTFYLDTKPVDAPFPRPPHPPPYPSSPSADPTVSDLPFGINLSSGVVYTRDRVSRRHRSAYDFSVVVRSRSDPPRKDRAQVVVHVNDPVLGRLGVGGGGPSGAAVPLLGVWWRGALTGIGWMVFVGALAVTMVVVVVVVVVVASIRRRRNSTKTKQTTLLNEAATRSASFWSNPDALTPPPPPEVDAGKGNKAAAAAAAAAGDDDVFTGGRRRLPSSSTDDASYECPNGNPDASQCQWCSSSDLPPMSSAPMVVYDNHHTAVPGDARGQNLGNLGFRPIGDAAGGGGVWRERYLTATPPGEYRRQQPYSASSSPMHMASTYQIRHPSRPGGGGGGGGGGSGTLERRTVRFQGNADNDFRRMYGDLAVNPACVAIGSDSSRDHRPASQI